jgi:hypothetical protein
MDGYPLFRCNRALFAYWTAGGILRRQLCDTISKTWKTGAVLLTPKLYAVGFIAPNGIATELKPPYRRFEMWQICNKPSAKYQQCACRHYYDPESGSAWGKRDKERGQDLHHPHCQFERRAKEGWLMSYKSAVRRLSDGQAPQARPDEWNRFRQEVP